MNRIFTDEEGRLYKKTPKGMEKLSKFTDHHYSLRVFNGVPVLEIDGVRMHLIKNFKTPLDYSKEVCKLIRIKEGEVVLDSCGGLGYTAVEASKKAKKVISIEKNKSVLELGKENPYSKEYFNNKNIEIINADSSDEIKKFPDEKFDKIIHDPPRMNFAHDLYSLEFYKKLFRVLKPEGILFHYVGFFGWRKGRRIEDKVRDKLLETGFRNLRYSSKCCGWTAKTSSFQKRD